MKAQSGRIGGLKGGQARAKKLTSEEGTAIARKVARTRWKKQFNNMIACAKLQLNYDRHPHLKISREALDWFAPRSKAGIRYGGIVKEVGTSLFPITLRESHPAPQKE